MSMNPCDTRDHFPRNHRGSQVEAASRTDANLGVCDILMVCLCETRWGEERLVRVELLECVPSTDMLDVCLKRGHYLLIFPWWHVIDYQMFP